MTLPVLVHRFDPDVPLPSYAHPGDAGADLVTTVDVTLAPGERAVLPTGVGIALPVGYAAFVHPRSGLAARHGVSLVNAPGTIDSGYRGEIQVVLLNGDPRETLHLRRGDRVAQLVIQRVEAAEFREVAVLPETVRGAGGFGSTGGFGSGPGVAVVGTDGKDAAAGPAAGAPAAGVGAAGAGAGAAAAPAGAGADDYVREDGDGVRAQG